MAERIHALGFALAKSDAAKAMLLSAIIDFGRNNDIPGLVDEAQALMPPAHPFKAPEAWREQYDSGFTEVADEERGVYRDDMRRYGTEYWQALTDLQRQERLEKPALGYTDGREDAGNLNDA